MDSNTVRGLINQLLYSIQFVPDLSDDASVEYVAESIRTQRNFRHSPAEYSEAIAIALDDGHLPLQSGSDLQNSEHDVVEWLGRLGQVLGPAAQQDMPQRSGPRPQGGGGVDI